VRHHGTDPRQFLWETHQFADLSRMVVRHGALKDLLRHLPGRKIIFSNAPGHYTEAVLKILGIRHCFDSVWHVERLAFTPKPFTGAFRRLLSAERLDPRRCIMVEDSALNLKTAKRLGMKTVLISSASRVPTYVDARIKSVLDLSRLGLSR
jgi:putative hydrolase of the HAD superfamily